MTKRTSIINSISQNYYNQLQRKSNLETIIKKVEVIVFVLTTDIPWKSLINYPYEESSYRKMFYSLCKLKIFKKEVDKLKNTEASISYIDSTTITNKVGDKDTIGFCPQNKKHKGNKVSMLVNGKGKPIGYSISKASTHDIKLFNETIKNVKTNTIVGDKAYVSKQLKESLKNKGIKLLTPLKKNNKKDNLITKDEEKILKRRHIVENTFANLKKFRRLTNRYEYRLLYFIGFVELGILLLNT